MAIIEVVVCSGVELDCVIIGGLFCLPYLHSLTGQNIWTTFQHNEFQSYHITRYSLNN